MHNAVIDMLKKYNCNNVEDYTNATKEIIQEIALLGLWRSKFFEKAAFYGGTALRILYNLDRFSEDLDFSLLFPDDNFKLDKYNHAVVQELKSFGFLVEILEKPKMNSSIRSAFIKTGTKQQLIKLTMPEILAKKIHANHIIKIKMEIDINPPLNFETETKVLLQPVPFAVNSYKPPDLFAGKMHALLCRKWELRVKGRDWYDFVWYISKNVPLKLKHLESRLKQSGNLQQDLALTKDTLLDMLNLRIEKIDFNKAKEDVSIFIKNKANLDIWSNEFFHELAKRITFI